MVPAPQATAPTPTATDSTGDSRGQTAVVTRPRAPPASGRGAARSTRTTATPSTWRPGPRPRHQERRRHQDEDRQEGRRSAASRNPIAFVLNYLKQVVAELRKVIWPNRKQMVSYTTVVLVFLAFMVALIGLVDLGLAKLVMLVFG